MIKPKNILFITPSSSRGGSEKYIWNIFTNLKYTRFKGGLFSLNSGVLFDDYNHPENSYHSNYTSSPYKLLLKGLIRRLTGIHLIEREIFKVHNKLKIDVWYLNTAIMPEIAELAIRNNIPYIVHFHEMLSVYDGIDKGQFFPMLSNSKALIACSNSVAQPLMNAGIQNVIVEYENVDTTEINIKKSPKIKKLELNINDDKFVWLMSGQRNYRKGMDYFIDIARNVQSNIHLIWIGGHESSNLSQLITKTIQNLGLKNVSLIEEQGANYYDYLNLSDGLLLTSREDPFPLVMAEAAFLGKPTVGFDSGGIREFINSPEIGIVIDNFDIPKLCKTLNSIADGNIVFNKNRIMDRSKEFSLKNRLPIWEQKILKILE